MLVRNCQVAGERVDVRFEDTILEVRRELTQRGDEQVIEAGGGVLLPGLHDHHIHLRALVAHRSSLSLAGVNDNTKLARMLTAHPGSGWLRYVDYHDGALGELDRDVLDCVARPVRVQHRSGKLWVLNSAARPIPLA